MSPPTAPAGPDASYVALIRGINVGKAKRVPMGGLRAMLTELGLGEVRTLLQSGNVVFTSDGNAKDIAASIEAGLSLAFHVDARCLVRPGAEISRVVARNPWPDKTSQGSRLLVLFVSDQLGTQSAPDRNLSDLDPGRVQIDGDVVYQWCPDGLLAAPPVSAFIEKHWPVSVTGRNFNTVTKLDALLRR